MSEPELMEKDEEKEEEKEEDTFSNSANGSSDEEEANEEKITELQKQLEASPYTYELHVQIISLCRTFGDLYRLRYARENMSKVFPLTQDLWLEWLEDEKKLVETDEEKDDLISLYDRSVKDYSFVSVWLDYVQFIIENIGESWCASGLEIARQVCERAITAVGIHVTQGYSIWEAYRDFETKYLSFIKSNSATEDQIKDQEDRIYNLLKRQLSIPLFGMSINNKTYMEKTYMDFKEFLKKSKVTDLSAVDYGYNKALEKLKKLQKFEENLFQSESPHYEEYKLYIDFEKKEKEPVRIQNLYERAIIENCLKEELWLDYVTYMDRDVKIKDMSFLVYERAVRNCPWCAPLWVKYGRTLERYEEPHETITRLFETALTMGFSKEEDFKEIWLGYLDYMTRRTKKQVDSDTSTDFKDVTDVFDRAVSQMELYFGGSESQYVIVKYWIFFNSKYLKDIPIARQLWENLIDYYHKEEARSWLDYANFEKIYGDHSDYRKALLNALSYVTDWPETFVDLLLTFEREEGTLESFEKTEKDCDEKMKNINRKRVKKMEEVANSMKKEDKRGSRSSKRQSLKSKNSKEDNSKSNSEIPVQMDSEGFKIPPPPPDKTVHCNENRLESQSDNKSESRKRASEASDLPEPKKKKVETCENHGLSIKHNPEKDDRTVFLSNLAYEIDEEKIREFTSSIGEIEEIRLVKDFKGRSKGYCYVVYKSELDAKKALEKDREKLEGRPVLVSPCEDKKSPSTSRNKLKFSSGLEKNKVFVKNIPPSVREKELEDLFKEHGVLKCVRIVTYRNGHSKGLAYIEYADEASAANAVLRMDGAHIQNKVISVAISNPPPRKVKNEFLGGSFSGYSSNNSSSKDEVSHISKSETSQNKGGGSFSRAGSSFGPRGRGRTQLSMLPRALARPLVLNKNVPNSSTLQNGQNSDTTDSSERKSLSNSDFAEMMKK